MAARKDMFKFSDVIFDLERCGWTLTAIAKAVGVAQPQISRLKNQAGAEPRYSLGNRIMRLHRAEMVRVQQERVNARNSQAKNNEEQQVV
jgi:predicted transcriptional regulator